MGRLIDAYKLINKLWGTGLTQKHLKIIEDMPTVEAIPKDQYEVRLKADMVAMLSEIQLEIEEKGTDLCDDGWWITYNNLIQEKINTLRGGEDGNND